MSREPVGNQLVLLDIPTPRHDPWDRLHAWYPTNNLKGLKTICEGGFEKRLDMLEVGSE